MDVDGDNDDDVEEAASAGNADTMEIDGEEEEDDDDTPRKRGKANSGAPIARKRAPHSNRQLAGLRDEAQASKAIRMRNVSQRRRNMLAKAGESDRAIRVKMPKHLFSGKRKAGKTSRR